MGPLSFLWSPGILRLYHTNRLFHVLDDYFTPFSVLFLKNHKSKVWVVLSRICFSMSLATIMQSNINHFANSICKCLMKRLKLRMGKAFPCLANRLPARFASGSGRGRSVDRLSELVKHFRVNAGQATTPAAAAANSQCRRCDDGSACSLALCLLPLPQLGRKNRLMTSCSCA